MKHYIKHQDKHQPTTTNAIYELSCFKQVLNNDDELVGYRTQKCHVWDNDIIDYVAKEERVHQSVVEVERDDGEGQRHHKIQVH